MQQDHYFRHRLHAKQVTCRPEGGGHRLMSTTLNTPLLVDQVHSHLTGQIIPPVVLYQELKRPRLDFVPQAKLYFMSMI